MNDPGHGQASRHATCEGNPRMSAASSLCPLLVLLIVCDRCGVRCEVRGLEEEEGVTCGPVSLCTSGWRYQSPSEMWAVSCWCCAFCLSGSWESWRANSELITHYRRSTNIGRDAPYLASLLISLEQADVRMLSLILCWCQPRSVSAGLYHAEYITDTQPSSRVRHLAVMRVTRVLC